MSDHITQAFPVHAIVRRLLCTCKQKIPKAIKGDLADCGK